MKHLFPACLVSGGQTGADRAALDFAIAHGITHAGHCSPGRKAEDGPLPAHYQLIETRSANVPERTQLNVDMADATLIFHPAGHGSRGTVLIVRHARRVGKPFVVLPHFPDIAADAALLRAFLEEHAPRVLNVAGSRESSQPGLAAHVGAVLAAVLPPADPG